jgi:hypothetical protein
MSPRESSCAPRHNQPSFCIYKMGESLLARASPKASATINSRLLGLVCPGGGPWRKEILYTLSRSQVQIELVSEQTCHKAGRPAPSYLGHHFNSVPGTERPIYRTSTIASKQTHWLAPSRVVHTRRSPEPAQTYIHHAYRTHPQPWWTPHPGVPGSTWPLEWGTDSGAPRAAAQWRCAETGYADSWSQMGPRWPAGGHTDSIMHKGTARHSLKGANTCA